MGTCCAPSYANLYMGGWEQFLFSFEGLAIYLCHVISCIDDVLMFWDVDLQLFEQFVTALNSNDFNLDFTATYNQKFIIFLDVTIYIQKDGQV